MALLVTLNIMAALFHALAGERDADQHRARIRRPRVFRDRLNPLDTLNDAEIIERYRLPRHFILELVDLLRNDIDRVTARSHAIPATLQVLITLRCLAKGIFYVEAADLHGVSKSSVCVAMDRVLEAICNRLNNITFPSTDGEIRKCKQQFYELAHFPNVIGAVDGTLIKIQAPANDEPIYICRKGYHALNVQAIVDASLRFTNVVCKYAGSVHDAFILENSNINDELKTGNNGWILGDSGYPLKHYLMTPISNPATRAEQRYNHKHSQTRVVVERAFGVLKSRFRCLHPTGGVLPFSVRKCVLTIVACFKLHNKCLEMNVQMPENDMHVPDNEAVQQEQQLNNDRRAQQIRDRLVQSFHNN